VKKEKVMPAPVSHEAFDRAALDEAAEAMERVLGSEPELGDFGFGVFLQRGKTPDEREVELLSERDDIRRPDSLAAFIKTREWLSRHGKRKTLNKMGTSYGLKHVCEKDVGYITNGVFIAAAIAEGFHVRRTDWGSPNAFLNISSSAWRRPAAPVPVSIGPEGAQK
jgi:hypothetical protein